jgi:acetylglutamate synthase
MFDIGKYLEKFKVIGNSRNFIRDSVAANIKEITGIDIDPKKIDIKDGIVRVNEKTIIKSEIFLKKARILDAVNSKVEKKIVDIL